jgi:FHA domain/Domain of unknown function (DUF4864)
MATLRLVPVSGNPIDVTQDNSLVGRDPGCDIVVTDGSVSRKHARLERRGEAWYVVDQGSANGTYVDSLKVGEAALKNGQELRFGVLAFRVDFVEDPEATVAGPIPMRETDTVMAPSVPPTPPAVSPPPPPPPPPPLPPPPVPRAATAPPPPSAAAARERFHPPGRSPVPPMAGGAPPAKKGKGPLFWILTGCCGCLLAVALLAALVGGGVFVLTQGAARAVHSELALVRQGDLEAAYDALSTGYKSEMSREEFVQLVGQHPALQSNKDATFYSRSVHNDRAVLAGVVVSSSGESEHVRFELVKEGGEWKVSAIRFDGGFWTHEE